MTQGDRGILVARIACKFSQIFADVRVEIDISEIAHGHRADAENDLRNGSDAIFCVGRHGTPGGGVCITVLEGVSNATVFDNGYLNASAAVLLTQSGKLLTVFCVGDVVCRAVGRYSDERIGQSCIG